MINMACDCCKRDIKVFRFDTCRECATENNLPAHKNNCMCDACKKETIGGHIFCLQGCPSDIAAKAAKEFLEKNPELFISTDEVCSKYK